jgi:hypothetical protein
VSRTRHTSTGLQPAREPGQMLCPQWVVTSRAARGLVASGSRLRGLEQSVVAILGDAADDPRPGWPFPFPEREPPPEPVESMRADLEALQSAFVG